MGLIIVMIVGAILGWLIAIVVDRDGRLAAVRFCTLTGAAGATLGAVAAGDVPLFAGVSATQLVGTVIGAIVAISVLSVVRSLLISDDQAQSLPTRRDSGAPAPIRR